MFLFDFLIAAAIVGGAAAVFYMFFFNVSEPKIEVKPVVKKVASPKKANKKLQQERAAKEAEIDALIAADLKAAAQGIRNDSRRGVPTTLEETNRLRERAAAKKAEASSPAQPVASQQEDLVQDGFVAVKSENKKKDKKPSQKAEVEREVLTAAEEMDRRLRQFFRQNNNNSKKFSSPNTFGGQDDRKNDAPIRIKATGANKGWGGEDN